MASQKLKETIRSIQKGMKNEAKREEEALLKFLGGQEMEELLEVLRESGKEFLRNGTKFRSPADPVRSDELCDRIKKTLHNFEKKRREFL